MVTRFKNRLWKKFSLDTENIRDEWYIDDAEIRQLYQFIGVIVPGYPKAPKLLGLLSPFVQ
jgi:hypothetical protein